MALSGSTRMTAASRGSGQPARLAAPADGRLVRAAGEQELDELVAQPLALGDGGGLGLHVAVDGCRGEAVDEHEHRLGERGERRRLHADVQRGRRDVVPGDPGADLVGRQQGRQVAPLVELDPPDLLEQRGMSGMAGGLLRFVVRLFGDLDQPLEERAGGGGHLDLLGLEERRVVGPVGPEPFPDVVEDLWQVVAQRRHQPRQLAPRKASRCPHVSRSTPSRPATARE